MAVSSENTKLEKFWYSKSHWKWLLLPLSWLVQLVALSKVKLYKLNYLKSQSSKVAVLVVGNITVGGTGKTPFISLLVERLQAKGLKVAIVSRGYHSKAPYYPYIVNKDDTVETVGDEAFMQLATCNVPMAIGAKRAEAVELLTKKYELDLIISDDGLQHYSMARNIEVMMVDSNRLFGNQLMLPFGPLREPVSRINSVDFVVLNGGTPSLLDFSNTLTNVIGMQIEIDSLVQLVSGKEMSLRELNNNSVLAVAGIGNPNRFFTTLSKYCQSFDKKVFADHYLFTASDFPANKMGIVVMTEKDAVKCKGFAKENWYYLKVKATMQEQELKQLYSRIEQVIK